MRQADRMSQSRAGRAEATLTSANWARRPVSRFPVPVLSGPLQGGGALALVGRSLGSPGPRRGRQVLLGRYTKTR